MILNAAPGLTKLEYGEKCEAFLMDCGFSYQNSSLIDQNIDFGMSLICWRNQIFCIQLLLVSCALVSIQLTSLQIQIYQNIHICHVPEIF